ncbi:MAG: DUF356 domain-containing protein [Methanomicrobia archaeon]|nr:DUF356 domain-containing protein [Methanomicrobia archaeon]MCK4433303.1 DUF356 domain-containing protein [Methanomicrobia archaeon]MCK4636432.1 DUF356 domain-containing protein [Methanomicrobia archaeon]
MVCFIIFRTDSIKKALTALADLIRHGKIRIYDPKLMPSEMAEKIMLDLCGEIKNPKDINVVAKTNEKGGRVIFSLKKIHPPAHLIVVTSRHDAFDTIKKEFSTYRTLRGFTSPKKIIRPEKSNQIK